MNIKLINGLPFVSLILRHNQSQLKLDNILLDTGSGGTVFSIDIVSAIDILPSPSDEIHRIRGVGGVEYVFEKIIDSIELGDLKVENFVIEIGQIDYGFNIQGILGIDFLIETNAVIDLGKRELFKSSFLG
jgi:hypothetical protein